MIQLKDPCKKCLVRPSCSKGCEAKQKYYNDRVWKIGLIYCIFISVIQMVVWLGLCFLFPTFPHNKFHVFLFIICLLGIALYITDKFNVFNLRDHAKDE
jgi:hypothetical protein